MKKTLLIDEGYYFEAFMKTVQYLANLTTHKGIMNEIEKLVKKFYSSDFFAYYEFGVDGTLIEHRNKISNNLFSKKGLEKIEEITVQALESGFFASELINPPDPYAMVFLPISKANQIISVIVIGHKYSKRLPKYLLNIYLALGGLIGTTIEKLTMIQELRKQHDKLKENDRFLTNIFSSIKDGICVIDTDYNIIRVNPTMQKWYSFMGPLSRKKCYQVFMNKTERCEACRLDESLKTNKLFVKIIPRKGNRGEIIGTLDVYTFPLHDQETGKITGVIEYLRDITERCKVEQQLKATLEDLQRSNTELEEFAFIASHDLQEPLRMIASFTQLLQSRYQDKLDDEANEFINFAVDGATRMQGLINDLLTFSRIGTKGISFSPTDMNIILENVLTNILQSTIEADAKITYDPLPAIIADGSQMGQILQNLISNALKFRGKNPIHIHVSGEKKPDEWIFSVRDNGIGIDSKHFERIFVIFQRLHKRDEYEGTGIGLAVCKKIIQRHSGKIWVESKLGKGSTFYFTIPKKIKIK